MSSPRMFLIAGKVQGKARKRAGKYIATPDGTLGKGRLAYTPVTRAEAAMLAERAKMLGDERTMRLAGTVLGLMQQLDHAHDELAEKEARAARSTETAR